MSAELVFSQPTEYIVSLPEKTGPQIWKSELKKYGIIYGHQDPIIEKISRQAGHTIQQDEPIVLAKGTLPINEGYHFKYYFNFMRSQTVDPKEKIDYKQLGYGCDVFQGQLLAEQQLIGPGEQGTNVLGEKVPFDRIKNKGIEYNQNVTIEKSGHKTRFYSKIDGVLQNNLAGQLRIDSSMRIRGNAGVRTGNVSSKYSVEIDREVDDHYCIRSLKNITVRGTVGRGAILEADGDIVIDGGVARDARLIAKGNITLKFAQGARIESHGDLKVLHYLYDSDVRVKGRVVCENPSDNGKRGTVIGGVINAIQSIELQTVGSENNLTTLITGCDHFYIREVEHLKERQSQVQEELKRQLRKIDPELLKGDIKENISRAPRENQPNIKRQIKHLLGLKGARNELISHLEGLKSRNFGKNDQSSIKIHKNAYPDLKVNINNCETMIYNNFTSSILRCENEKIIIIQS